MDSPRLRRALAGVMWMGAVAVTAAMPQAAGAQNSRGARALQAMEAARADAYRTLLETISGFSLEGSSKVRDLVMESSETRVALDSFVRGAQVLDEHFEPDGSATVKVALDLNDLEKLLGKRLKAGVRTVTATGRGAPRVDPDTAERQSASTSPVRAQVAPGGAGLPDKPDKDVPEWSTTVTVIGQAAIVAKRGQTATQARLLGERAAVNDAYRRLLEYVFGVQVSAETTVGDLCLKNDTLRSTVDAFIRGAVVESTRTVGDMAEAKVSLDLAGMEDILR